MLEKYIEAIESLDWYITDWGDSLDIGMMSDAGEDFSFSVTKDNLAQNIIDYALEFDPEEHAEMWVDAKLHGTTQGIPDIYTLVHDADSIAEYLNELADKIMNIRREGN